MGEAMMGEGITEGLKRKDKKLFSPFENMLKTGAHYRI